jgi:hypothetical protein
MAFGYYHLACMLLAIYKPSPKFAVRGVNGTARESDVSSDCCYGMNEVSLTLFQIRVMKHARAICGACNSSPSTVPSLITLCHSTFICEMLLP